MNKELHGRNSPKASKDQRQIVVPFKHGGFGSLHQDTPVRLSHHKMKHKGYLPDQLA